MAYLLYHVADVFNQNCRKSRLTSILIAELSITRLYREGPVLHRSAIASTSIWLLGNLSLDGKLCLRDDRNAAFDTFTISRRCHKAWTTSRVGARLSVIGCFPTLWGPSQPSVALEIQSKIQLDQFTTTTRGPKLT